VQTEMSRPVRTARKRRKAPQPPKTENCSRCVELRRRVDGLERENEKLRKLLDEARRAGKRQAAPFSKGDPKKDPKKPGRKPGKAYGKRGSRPRPSKVDRVLEAPIEEICCRDCGGEIEHEGVEEQFLTDIPKTKPTVMQINVHRGKCTKCGRRVQSRHPDQVSEALGAASNQIGPNAIALAVDLNKSMGVSDGRISKFFQYAFGLSVHRSTLRRAFLRAARKAEPLYEHINVLVRTSGIVYPDETGWKVAGERAWL